MLLSIVECSDYRNSKGWRHQLVPTRQWSENVEVLGPVRGPNVSIMRNRGALKAQGRWVFFKDSDCDVEISRLEEICQKIEKETTSVAAIGGVYKNKSQGFLASVYSFIQRIWVLNGILPEKPIQSFHEADQLLGGALLVNRETFIRLGGFDESIGWGGEELDLVLRLRKNGFKTGVSYRLQVFHKNSLGLFGLVKRAWYQNFNRTFFQMNSSSTWKEKRRYFGSPLVFWPSIALFFGVAQFASATGRVVKKMGRIWN